MSSSAQDFSSIILTHDVVLAILFLISLGITGLAIGLSRIRHEILLNSLAFFSIFLGLGPPLSIALGRVIYNSDSFQLDLRGFGSFPNTAILGLWIASLVIYYIVTFGYIIISLGRFRLLQFYYEHSPLWNILLFCIAVTFFAISIGLNVISSSSILPNVGVVGPTLWAAFVFFSDDILSTIFLFILHKEKDNILFLYSSQHQYPAAFYRSYTILKWIITIPWIAFLITFLPMYFYSPSSTFSLLLALEVSIQFALCCKYVLTVFVVDAKMALEYDLMPTVTSRRSRIPNRNPTSQSAVALNSYLKNSPSTDGDVESSNPSLRSPSISRPMTQQSEVSPPTEFFIPSDGITDKNKLNDTVIPQIKIEEEKPSPSTIRKIPQTLERRTSESFIKFFNSRDDEYQYPSHEGFDEVHDQRITTFPRDFKHYMAGIFSFVDQGNSYKIDDNTLPLPPPPQSSSSQQQQQQAPQQWHTLSRLASMIGVDTTKNSGPTKMGASRQSTLQRLTFERKKSSTITLERNISRQVIDEEKDRTSTNHTNNVGVSGRGGNETQSNRMSQFRQST